MSRVLFDGFDVGAVQTLSLAGVGSSERRGGVTLATGAVVLALAGVPSRGAPGALHVDQGPPPGVSLGIAGIDARSPVGASGIVPVTHQVLHLAGVVATARSGPHGVFVGVYQEPDEGWVQVLAMDAFAEVTTLEGAVQLVS